MLALSFYDIVLLAITSFVSLVAWRILQSRVLSPLKDVPGPFLAGITGYWLILVDLAGDRTSTIHDLHKKYGDAVRIGPNEVSFSGAECIKEIYGQQTVYMKAPIYDTFSLPPVGIFSMRDKREHSQRRKLLSHAFSLANLYETEPLIVEYVSKAVSNIQKQSGMPINVLALFRMLALDIVGELFLGTSFGALDSTQPPAYLEDVDRHFLISGIDGNFPWLYRFISSLPVPKLQHFFASRHRLEQYGHNAFVDYVQRNGRDSKRKDLLTKILVPKSEDTADTEVLMSDKEICFEIGNLVFAGTDTTSTTLTYLFWELAQNPSWQSRLRAELHSAASKETTGAIMSYKSLQDLPVLDAVISEGLRLHPAAPASLQRIVPKGGGLLGGVYVPEKTIVSMQCYTTQRNPTAFPEPDKFQPERWMTAAGPSKEMKELFMPFSKGTRACLGIHLAMMELKLTTAALMTRYRVSVAKTMQPGDMDMKDHFLVLPASGKCDLVFEPATRKAQT